MPEKEQQQKEIMLIEGSKKMALVDPQKKMEFAKKAAKVLMDTIDKTNAILEIQGNKYLKFEGWQMLASFFGLSVGIEFIAPLENGEGYKAKAVVYTRDGTIVGSAWGICSRKEPGKENFTFTKLLGMAQTRAAARALKQILGWIAPLGGFKETPAEEVENGEEIPIVEEN